MALELYFKLCSRSRKAIAKTTGRFGSPYDYRPRGDLLQRLSRETGLTVEQVYHQLQNERKEILQSQP